MSQGNPFDQAPNLPGVGPNLVDPATNATGPAPMPPETDGVSPSPSTGTEGWGLGKDEPETSGQPGRKNNVEDAA